MRTIEHNLHPRGKAGIYQLEFSITTNGKQSRFRKSLHTTNLNEALKKRAEYLDPFRRRQELDALAKRIKALQSIHNEELLVVESKMSRDNTALINLFINDRITIQKTSPKEIDYYRKILPSFNGHIKGKGVALLTGEDLTDFYRKLLSAPRSGWWDGRAIPLEPDINKRLSDKTAWNIFMKVSAFLAFLADQNVITKNPCKAVRVASPKSDDDDDEGDRIPPPPEIAKKLRDIPAPSNGRFDAEAWSLYIELISRIGARKCELGRLKKDGIHYDVEIPWILIPNLKQKSSKYAKKGLPIPTILRARFKAFVDCQQQGYVFHGLGIRETKHDTGRIVITFGTYFYRLWVTEARKIYPDMDFHTWRHYVNTAVRSKYTVETGCAILGHRMNRHDVNDIYDHRLWYNHNEMKKLLEAIDSVP